MRRGPAAARRPDPAFWTGKRVLLTGHTGFKGGWLSLWLAALGAKVTGFALPPPAGEPSLFALARVERDVDSRFGDLRDRERMTTLVAAADPQIVLHLAAQPLVRHSFADPVGTHATNIIGTVHLLEALRACTALEAVLVVTTDKVYSNDGAGAAFVEGDRLGGHDPYAASKAAAEIVAASYAASFFEPRGVALCTARGGNVIGGGDFSADRLVPDIWRALRAQEPLALRYPQATRPWQHVLDCVAGYLLYAEALREADTPRALNFGPAADADRVSVAALAEAMQLALGASQGWRLDGGRHPPEMSTLAIDSSLARRVLGWSDRLPGRAAVEATAAWFEALANGTDMRAVTLAQIERYGTP